MKKNGSCALPRKLACWPGVTEPSRMTCGYATNVGIRRVDGASAIDDRAVGREQVERVAQADVVDRRRVPGQA